MPSPQTFTVQTQHGTTGGMTADDAHVFVATEIVTLTEPGWTPEKVAEFARRDAQKALPRKCWRVLVWVGSWTDPMTAPIPAAELTSVDLGDAL